MSSNLNGQLAKPPRIAVLLAAYNGERWLAAQLESISKQVDVEICLFVSDDRSSDKTLDAIKAFAEKMPLSLKLQNSSSGSAGGNFRSLFADVDISSFDYVALADQDDVWAVDKLSNAICALNRSGASGYSSAVESFWPDGRKSVVAQNPHKRNADFLFEGGGHGCTYLLKPELFERVQTFCREHKALADTLHYHDWLVYLLARVDGMVWYFDAQASIAYRQHGGNEIGSRGSLGAISLRLKKIKNGWYRRQIDSAVAVSLAASPLNIYAKRLHNILSREGSIRRRVELARFVAAEGRRRFSDRVVLVFAAMVGWI